MISPSAAYGLKVILLRVLNSMKKKTHILVFLTLILLFCGSVRVCCSLLEMFWENQPRQELIADHHHWDDPYGKQTDRSFFEEPVVLFNPARTTSVPSLGKLPGWNKRTRRDHSFASGMNQGLQSHLHGASTLRPSAFLCHTGSIFACRGLESAGDYYVRMLCRLII